MLFILFTLFFFFLTPSPALALEEFSITQNLNYQIDARGNATVKQTLIIKNNLSQIYPKEYHLNLSQPDISQINAYDNEGQMDLKTQEKEDVTLVDLVLNNPKVGQGEENQFTLEYKISQFVKAKGRVWELTTPKFNDFEKIESLNLDLFIPLAFGDITYTSKRPSRNNQSSLTHRQLTYTKNELTDKVLIAFGQFQLFDFKLNYFLKNPSSESQTQEITIPPSTSRQFITIRSFRPKPENIISDQDGNWIAQYLLKPQESLDIILEGQAKIDHFSPPSSQTVDPSLYTSSDQFWPSEDPTIQSISKNLDTPQKIYEYVQTNLDYDYENISAGHRKGALSALLDPTKSLCTEFTDLFITLARSRGIAAREVQGFAYTNNLKVKPTNQDTDILHAWPEYLDEKKNEWIPVDPTWGKTTGGIDYFHELDLNHLSFVFHGINSQKPLSPGFYKGPTNQKTIQVEFAQKELEYEQEKPTLELQKENQSLVLVIKNPNNTALYDLSLDSKKLNLEAKISTLPPFSYQKIELNPQKISRILDQNFTINLNQTPLSISNPFRQKLFLPLVSITVILSIIGFIFLKKK